MRYLAAALVLALSTTSFAELVSNGDFESPSLGVAYTTYTSGSTSLTNWTIASGSIDHIGNYWQANGGSQSLDMSGNNNSPGTITQTLSTVSGQGYTLRFYMAGNPDNGTQTVSMTVTAVGSTTDLNQTPTFNVVNGTNTTTNMGWALYQFNFIASSNSEVLSFTSNVTSAFGPTLDDVSVLESPEPGAFVLFGVGLAGLGLWRRSQKRRAAAPSA